MDFTTEIHQKTSNHYFDFSIIIPTWNNLQYLQFCLKSLEENSTLKIQPIIFVNEGVDGTIDWLKNSNIDFLVSKKNVGICYAVNKARELAKANYIVYMNDDMVVLPKWDIHLLQEIKRLGHNNFMISSTMVEPYFTNNPCVVVKNYGDSIETFKHKELLSNYESLYRKNWNGSSWPPVAVHKDNWDKVAGFSVEYSPGMYSDPDFARKLYQIGIREFIGVGNSLVYHFGSKSTNRLKKSKGKYIFLKKWGITPRTFYQEILKIGSDYNKGLSEKYKLSLTSKFTNNLKRVLLPFKL